MEAPRLFRESIAAHNRHCWLAALLSLVGAWFGWLLFATFYTGGALLFETVRTGDASLGHQPSWLVPYGLGLIGAAFLAAAILRFRGRFRPVNDRAIIGWHLLPEVLLLPARMTFAIWDHIGARLRLDRLQMLQAWGLLQVIASSQRLNLSNVRSQVGDIDVEPLLLALQVTGWIDLHRGEADWFYSMRSEAEGKFHALLEQGGA